MMLKRPWSIWCSPEERAAIRARARAVGVPVSRLVLDLAFSVAGSGDGEALTAEEMADLLGGFRMLIAFVRMAKGGAVDTGGSGAGHGNGAPVAGDTEKGRRLSAERARLSISATTEEWATVQARARARGLSVSRYLVGLVLPDGGAAGLHGDPLPALSGAEQRELLEAARHMRSLLSGEQDSRAALPGMRERIVAPRGAGGPAPVGPSHEGESRCARLSGEEPAEPAAAPVSCSPGATENPERTDGNDTGPPPEPGPRKPGTLL